MTTTQPRVTDYLRDQLGPPLVLIGGFFRMCVLAGKALFRPPFQWKEFIIQCWFILRVAILPTMAVTVDELRSRAGRCFDRVAAGETIWLVRGGRLLAQIVSIAESSCRTA